MAAECAAEQGKFWEYHDELYRRSATEGSSLFTGQGLIDLAGDLGFEQERFGSCLTEGRRLDELRADSEAATALGVRSVPTIFINDVQYQGPRTFESMSARIEEILAKK